MERRFYNDDGFEQFLRDATEHFRMYPNKKVWHSIYNDIHPSRKWPSLSALLILISSVMFIGVSNTRPTVGKDAAYIASLNLRLEPLALSTQEVSFTATPDELKTIGLPLTQVENESSHPAENSNEPSYAASLNMNQSDDALPIIGRSITAGLNDAFAMQVSSPQPVMDMDNHPAADENISSITETPTRELDNLLLASVETQTTTPETAGITSLSGDDNEHSVTKETEAAIADILENSMAKQSETEMADENKIKHWIDEYAFYTMRNKKQKKNPWSYHAYVTPSFGYRTLHSEPNFTPESFLQSTLIANSATSKLELVHNPAMNIELGGGVYYQLNRTVRLKAGLQMNFTNYKINAFGLSHAGMATVMMNSDIPQNPSIEIRPTYLSTVGNGNEIQLNSSTMQFSVPVGADVRLAGNNEITWYAGATIQPTYVAGGNAFIVSADHKHYIADATILRRFNMNAGVETFISYQPMKGVRLQVGPQFRYQLMSTYVKDYPMNERLYNIGIKMGITTRF